MRRTWLNWTVEIGTLVASVACTLIVFSPLYLAVSP